MTNKAIMLLGKLRDYICGTNEVLVFKR